MMSDAQIVPADFAPEFASAAWSAPLSDGPHAARRLGMLRDGVTREVYRDVPAHLAPGGTIAWGSAAAGGSCTLDLVECADKEASDHPVHNRWRR